MRCLEAEGNRHLPVRWSTSWALACGDALTGKANATAGKARRLIAAQEAIGTDSQCVPGVVEERFEAGMSDRHPLFDKLRQCRIWEQG